MHLHAVDGVSDDDDNTTFTGDSEDLFGRTKCYATDPSKLQLGWAVRVRNLDK